MPSRRFRRPSPARVLLALAAVALVPLVAVPPAGHAEVPDGATWTEVYFPSGDGTTLHADVFRPERLPASARTPVILAIGPYFNSSGSVGPTNPTNDGPTLRFPELFTDADIMAKGYTYVQVDSRGYGGSAGCSDLGGPKEQSDVKAAVEWAAKQPWSTGKVGMWGKSYDAWTQVMALAEKPKGLAAVVIQSPLIEAYRGFFMNGVHYDAGWYATPGLYAGIDAQPPSTESDPREWQNWASSFTDPACFGTNLGSAPNPDRTAAYWKARNVVPRARGSRVPTLWSHGFLDANTRADNFMDVWSTLRGPRRAWFGQYDHIRGHEAGVGRDGFLDEAMRWLERHLRGRRVANDPPVEVQDGHGVWRAESAWPPADARQWTLPVRNGSYVDAPRNSARNPVDGAWSFTTEAPYNLRLAGLPRLSASVSAAAYPTNLVALVYDVGPEGDATLITRGAWLATKAGQVSFDLYPQDWLLERGHRIGVFLSGSDSTWFTPTHTGQSVLVSRASLSVPFLANERRKFLAGDEAQAMGNRPAPTLDTSVVDANEVDTRWPPRPRR